MMSTWFSPNGSHNWNTGPGFQIQWHFTTYLTWLRTQHTKQTTRQRHSKHGIVQGKKLTRQMQSQSVNTQLGWRVRSWGADPGQLLTPAAYHVQTAEDLCYVQRSMGPEPLVAAVFLMWSDVKGQCLEGLTVCCKVLSFYFLKDFYLFIHETHRERGRDTGRGRSRLHAGSLTPTRSWVSGITPWAEGRCSPTEPSRCASSITSNSFLAVFRMFYL